MEDLIPICLYCDHIRGCGHLRAEFGGVEVDNVVTRENFRSCPDWTPVGPIQQATRDRACSMTGIGTIRMLFELPELAMGGIKQAEKEVQMLEETRNYFTGILRKGMLSSERDTQLRYEADEVGNTLAIDENGEKIYRARPDYELKRYASDPDGPIKLPHAQIIFWTADQTIDAIIRKEIELGWIVKDKKPKLPAIVSADSTETPQEANKEIVPMPAAAKRVRVAQSPNTNKPAPAQTQAPAAGPKRIGRPPAQAAAPAQPAPARLPPPVAGAQPPAGPGRVARPPARIGAPAAQPAQVAPGQVMNAVGADVGSVINKVEELAVKVEGIPAYIEALITQLRQDVIDMFTIQNDIMVQTQGTMQYPQTEMADDGNGGQVEQQVQDDQGNLVMQDMPLLFNHPDKFMAHVKGTAYNQAEETPAGE